MSATIEKSVTGVCAEVVQKPGSDWVEFHVDGGGQWPVKVATKLLPLIELGKAAGTNLATWTYKEVESDKINEKSGKPFVNRYLERVEVGDAAVVAQNEQSLQTLTSLMKPQSEPHHSPLIAGDKDRAITRMAVLKAAVEMQKGAMNIGSEADEAVIVKTIALAARFETWVYRDIDGAPF